MARAAVSCVISIKLCASRSEQVSIPDSHAALQFASYAAHFYRAPATAMAGGRRGLPINQQGSCKADGCSRKLLPVSCIHFAQPLPQRQLRCARQAWTQWPRRDRYGRSLQRCRQLRAQQCSIVSPASKHTALVLSARQTAIADIMRYILEHLCDEIVVFELCAYTRCQVGVCAACVHHRTCHAQSKAASAIQIRHEVAATVKARQGAPAGLCKRLPLQHQMQTQPRGCPPPHARRCLATGTQARPRCGAQRQPPDSGAPALQMAAGCSYGSTAR